MTSRRGSDPSDDASDNIGRVRYISLRVPDELYDRVRQHADADRRSLNVYLIILIENALDEIERKGRKSQERGSSK